MKIWAYVALAGLTVGALTGISTCSYDAGIQKERARWLENQQAINKARDAERAKQDADHATEITDLLNQLSEAREHSRQLNLAFENLRTQPKAVKYVTEYLKDPSCSRLANSVDSMRNHYVYPMSGAGESTSDGD